MSKTFTVSQVAAAAGVPTSTVKKWRARTQVLVGDTSGGWTRYTAEDAVMILVVGQLTRCGFDPVAAFQMAIELGPQLHTAGALRFQRDLVCMRLDLAALRRRVHETLNQAE